MKNIYKNKKGSAIIIIVFLALVGFMSLTIMASDIIKSNLIMSKSQLNSTKAYFAAEVGLEKALFEVMKGDYELPDVDKEDVFKVSDSDVSTISTFLNNGVYNVDYDRTNAIRTFKSQGGYSSEHRSTEVSFCIPNCEGVKCGEDDGCGTPCPPACDTDIGCRFSFPDHSSEVPGSDDFCCDSKKCYECNEDFTWDGSDCVYDCVQKCGGLKCGDIDPNCGKPCPASCDTDPGCVLSTDPAPNNAEASGLSCCDIAGSSYTCYQCSEGSSWNGSECVTCVGYEGDPFPGSTVCHDNGVYDCFGNQLAPVEQPKKGLSCSDGGNPIVYLEMNESSGFTVYDSTGNNYNGTIEGNSLDGHRKLITIDHSDFKSADNFPFLLDITDSDLFYLAQDDGSDIVFKTIDGIKIPHEIEYFNGNDFAKPKGRLVAWLKLPSISSVEDTKFYMYYGSSAASSPEDSEAVWSDYMGVWHMEDLSSLDSTAHNYDVAYSSDFHLEDAYIFNGIRTSGDSYATKAIDRPYTDVSWSFWLKTSVNIGLRYLQATTNSTYGTDYDKGPCINNGIFGYCPSNNSSYFISSGVNISDNTWHNVAVAVNFSNFNSFPCRFYVDGVATAGQFCTLYNATSVNLSPNVTHNFLGSSSEGDYNGLVDEMRMGSSMFTDNYFYDSYQNQNNPQAEVSLGAQEDISSGDSLHFPGIYGRSIVFDGSSNYISFADGDLPIDGDKTIEAWIYPVKKDGIMAIASKSWGFYIDCDGNIFSAPGGLFIGPNFYTFTNPTIPFNTWTHVAFTYEALSRHLIIYINGVDVMNVNLSSDMVSSGDLIIGKDSSGSFFSGKIDEFKAYDYVRTPAQMATFDNRDVCDGDGSCVSLVTTPSNIANYDTCNDICFADGRTCASVGTDSEATNGLMQIYNSGACDTIGADCSTVLARNPDIDTPFLCNGYQTDWTNCNCLLCDSNFGAACEANPCVVTGMGVINCAGECEGATFEPAGTPCGVNKKCDGLGVCRTVCHPLYGESCPGSGCIGAGTVNCVGDCVGGVEVPDGTICTNPNNDPLQDECWGGICKECVANYGNPCNVGECLKEGTVDCFGGCSACPPSGDCVAYPSYLSGNTPCDAGYGVDTGRCDGAGTCDACHADYINFGKVCNDEPCHVPGERDCETGICSTAGQLASEGDVCTSGTYTGACDASGVCQLCAPNYLNSCNNTAPCMKEGTIMCDGTTCSETGYRAEGDLCDAGYLTSSHYPDTGTCDASHNCNPCDSGYLDDSECNTEECHVAGHYTCDGGCDACVDGDCNTNPNSEPAGTHCDTGAPTTQAYSGTCDGAGNCDECVQGFLDGEACNDEECHVVGETLCDGTCSTGTQITPVGGECQGSIYDGYPGRQTGYCDASGACQDCNDDFVYDKPCWPGVGDESCYDYGAVYTCQGSCEDWSYKAVGVTCDTGAVTTQDYSGTCDGVGNCIECNQGFLDDADCNTGECHIPGKVQCDGTCSTGNATSTEGTICNTGAVTSQPYSGTCDDSGTCVQCSDGFLNAETCNTEKCHIPGYITCVSGTCSETGYLPDSTPCDAGIYDALVSPTGYCNTGTCSDCPSDYLYQTPCWPEINDEDCYNKGIRSTCLGDCNWTYKGQGISCGTGDNECDGAGVCTAPITDIVVLNDQTKSCNQVCEGSPYVNRTCVDIGIELWGTQTATNNSYLNTAGMTSILSGDCSTVMQAYTVISGTIYSKVTYCLCHKCDSNYEQVCVGADDCNNTSYYDCDGACVNNYIANNTDCDPDGAPTAGYCWFGTCVACDANMGNPCNTEECKITGVVECDGSCSTDADPYFDTSKHCDSGSGPDTGLCDGAGHCDYCDLAVLDTPCSVPSNRDSDCYDPGVYDCNDVCVNSVYLNEGGVCYDDENGLEGRCNSIGQCINCNTTYYGNSCPVVSPYDSNCYNAGTYDCLGDPPACVGSGYLNQGLYTCDDPDKICMEGECKSYPGILVVDNISTGTTCTDRCAYYGHSCYSIGTDSGATNGIYDKYTTSFDKGSTIPNYYCATDNGTCATSMDGGAISCDGNTAYWTKCLCTNCLASVFDDCSDNSMWDSYNYDDECYDFGTYDCDGNCENYGVITANEGTTCTTDGGIEGECASGECEACDATYINGVPCPVGDCQTSTRLCDGSCTPTENINLGQTCGATAGYECNLDGQCVLAATELVDIVVPNNATSRSCNSICENDYTNRTCKSIGTDDTQAGGTNGLIMYFGLDNGNPTCVEQAGGDCSSAVGKNPSSASDANYGFTCNEKLTNWTYCRCTNE